MTDRTDIRGTPNGGLADPLVAQRLGATRYWTSGRLDEGVVVKEAHAWHRTTCAESADPRRWPDGGGVATTALIVGDIAAFAEAANDDCLAALDPDCR